MFPKQITISFSMQYKINKKKFALDFLSSFTILFPRLKPGVETKGPAKMADTSVMGQTGTEIKKN